MASKNSNLSAFRDHDSADVPPANELIDITWDVVEDSMTKDVLLYYKISAKDGAVLLQVWGRLTEPGIAIPEWQRYLRAVAEFEPEHSITEFKGGLLDSKWQQADAGTKWHASVVGYVLHAGKVKSFATKENIIEFTG